MWKRLREHFLMLNKSRKELKQEGLKICAAYFLLGLFWILCSDRLVPAIVSNSRSVMLFSMGKGVLFVFCTSAFLYYVILRLLNKAGAAEEELSKSYKELKMQYKKIGLYDQMLMESEEKYRTIIAHMQLGMALFEGENETDIRHYRLIDVNPCYEELACDKEVSVLGGYFCDIHDTLDPDIWELLARTVKTGEPARYERFRNRTSTYYEVIVFCPGKNQLALIVNNITERRQAQERLNYLSFHDPLTGLYNRRYFEEQLKVLDQEFNYPLVITMADINGLKLINDSFGHAAGDEYIRKAAAVLMNNTRSHDIICRLGGDEFVIFSPGTGEKEIKKMISSMSDMAKAQAVNKIMLSISFGYSIKCSSDESITEVLKKAEDFMYRKKLMESPSMRGKTIYTIMAALHEKNFREEQHSLRVSELCEKMGEALELQEDDIKELKTVGLLHDIGKVAIEEGILNKNGKLDVDEWGEIKKHPEIGYRILSTVNELSEMADYVLAHHERWDGSGYPKGLKGKEIPIQSRIIAIADAYDAMISERSYRHALSKEIAISELLKGAGTQFCKEYVSIFIDKVINKSGTGA